MDMGVPAPFDMDQMDGHHDYVDESVSSVAANEQDDYRFWRYSKFALPFLLFLLALYVTLLCLTIWQAHSDIKELRSGLPRDLEPKTGDTAREGGIRKYKRNMRITISVIGIALSLLAFIIFVGPLAPKARTGANMLIGILLILTSILCWVTFALDVASERHARRCQPLQANAIYTTTECESREDIAFGVSIFDAALAIFTLLSGLMLIFYSTSGDWNRQNDIIKEGDYVYGANPEFASGMVPNGVSNVRKALTTLALLGTLIFAVLLLVFTILLHEDRSRIILRDGHNRPILQPNEDSVTTALPGWPRRNSALRYAVSAFVIVTILFNLIPLNSRIIAYILGFLYFCYAIVGFVSFALDVDSLDDANKQTCPSNILDCVYHPYHATAALDFIGAFFLLIYVPIEYLVLHRKPKAASAQL